jgi:hypothetical protein
MEHARSHFEARAIQEAVGIENPPDRWLAQEERDREQNERNAVQAPLLRRVSTLEACGFDEPQRAPSPAGQRPVLRRLSSKEIPAFSEAAADDPRPYAVLRRMSSKETPDLSSPTAKSFGTMRRMSSKEIPNLGSVPENGGMAAMGRSVPIQPRTSKVLPEF